MVVVIVATAAASVVIVVSDNSLAVVVERVEDLAAGGEAAAKIADIREQPRRSHQIRSREPAQGHAAAGKGQLKSVSRHTIHTAPALPNPISLPASASSTLAAHHLSPLFLRQF